MAIAHDAATAGAEVSSTTQTTAHTTGSGSDRWMAVAVAYEEASAQTITGVTYNGVALTSTPKQGAPSGGRAIQLWHLVAPATGANNVVVTASATTDVNVGIITKTGVDQSTPVSGQASASGDGLLTLTIASAVGDLVLGAATCHIGAIGSAGAGQTVRWSDMDDAAGNHGTEKDGAASVTQTWDGTSGFYWAFTGLSVKAAGGGASAFPSHYYQMMGH